MTRFKVDGIEYEMLEDDMTLGESGWFYRIAGVGIESLGDRKVGDTTSKIRALMAISIARARPEVPHREIEERLEAMKVSELEGVFEDEAGQSPPQESESEEPSEPSGEPGNDDSDASPDDADPAPTGSLRSVITSDYDRETAVGLHRGS